MSLVTTVLSLSNPINRALKTLTVKALVDTGSLHLCIPEPIVLQLGLQELEKREVTLADGHKKLVAYVGPVQIAFHHRHCFTGAMVMVDEILLSAIPMEDRDLVISPLKQTVEVNPQSPHIPSSIAKGFVTKKSSLEMNLKYFLF